MAADSRINIVLDVDTRNTDQIETTAARLTALGRAQKNTSADTSRLSGKMDELNGRMGRLTGQMNKLNSASNAFTKHARKIMYLAIGLAVEFAAVAVSLVSVNAAFAIGNALFKVYNWGMQGLAGALAAAGAAAITAAAAFTEFNAAAQAFRYKDSPALGSAISQSADALRMLQVNSTLATYGITALTQAYAAFGKNAKLDAKSVKQLEMMADFGTGPNRAKSLAAAAEYISLIKKQASGQYVKDAYGQRQSLASQIGPEFEKAAKKYGDPKKLLQALESGQLAKDAGVEGFGKTVNQTLVSQLKGYLTKALVELSDAGRYLLEPVKKTFHNIFGGLTRAFRMVRSDLINFGSGGLLGALEKLSEKTETFAIKLFREFLPAAAGWWKRTGDFFKGFVNEFNQARRSLDSMREGGSIVIDMFGKPIVQVFKRIGQNARAFAELAKENKPLFLQFGDALTKVVDGFMNIGNAVRNAFTTALPIINKVMTVVGMVFETIAKVFNIMAGMGAIGATMAVGGFARFAMKGTRGARFERRMARGVSGGMADFFGIGGQMANGGGGALAGGAGGISASMATVNAGTVILNGNVRGGGQSATKQAPDWAYKGIPSKGKSNAPGAAAQGGYAPMGLIPFDATSFTTLRGTGSVNRSGIATRPPARKPGQSSLEYQAEMKAWMLQNGGFGEYAKLDLPKNKRLTPGLRQKAYRQLMGIPEPRGNRIPLELRGRRAGSVRAIDLETEMLRVKRNLAPNTDVAEARRARLEELGNRYGMTISPEDFRRWGTSRKPYPVLPNGQYGPVYTGPPIQYAPTQTRMQQFWNRRKIDAKTGWADIKRRAGSLRGLPSYGSNSLRYLYNTVMPAGKQLEYQGSSAQIFNSYGGGISGAMANGGGGGPVGGPLPGSSAPSGAGPGQYIPTTRLRDWAGRTREKLFGPAWSGQPGQSKKVMLRNSVATFLTGAGWSGNVQSLMSDSNKIASWLTNNPDKTVRDFFADPNHAGINPMAIGGDGGKKSLGNVKARARALKMKGSAMGGGMLASIGTGMFLNSGMGQKVFGDADAQNAMNTGAMLMPFSPALGLGVGLAGTAWNSKTTLGGAASGLGAGAMLAMAAGGGPIAMAATAAVMATVGMWRSVVNKNKMAREGAKAIGKHKLMETVVASIGGAIKDGTSKGGRAALSSYGDFIRDFEKMNKKDRAAGLKKYVDMGLIDSRTAELMSGQGGYGQQAVGQLKRDYALQRKILDPMYKHFDDVMRGLQLATGKSSDEIMKLSAAAGVNLFDDTVSLTEVIQNLGVGMMQTAEQIKQSLRDITISSTDVFDQYKEQKGMLDAIQSSYNSLIGGNVTTESLIDYYQKGIDLEQLVGPDVGVNAFLNRYKQFVGGAAYAPGGQLAGVTPTDEFTQLVTSQLGKEQSGIASQFTTNIGQALADKNIGFESTQGGQTLLTSGVNALLSAAAQGDTTALARLTTLESELTSGTLFAGLTTPEQIMQRLASRLGITGKSTSTPKVGTTSSLQYGTEPSQKLKTLSTGNMTTDIIAGLGTGGAQLRTEILKAFEEGSKQLTDTPEWWSNPPEWFNTSSLGGTPQGQISKINGQQVIYDKNGPKGSGWYKPYTDPSKAEIVATGDTTTSRALRATMGAHARFNSMLPGKRMITSSWREWSLGSPSSDHTSGRAYDLTGDNLQQYAKSITGAGGFAEFHGVGGERHLHVVPPIGPFGDTSSARTGIVSSNSGATYGGDSFNITVVESSDARSTADEVVKRIMDLQKQARRRG